MKHLYFVPFTVKNTFTLSHGWQAAFWCFFFTKHKFMSVSIHSKGKKLSLQETIPAGYSPSLLVNVMSFAKRQYLSLSSGVEFMSSSSHFRKTNVDTKGIFVEWLPLGHAIFCTRSKLPYNFASYDEWDFSAVVIFWSWTHQKCIRLKNDGAFHLSKLSKVQQHCILQGRFSPHSVCPAVQAQTGPLHHNRAMSQRIEGPCNE